MKSLFECGQQFEASELSGAPDGRALCATCLVTCQSGESSRLTALIEAQGYVIKEDLLAIRRILLREH